MPVLIDTHVHPGYSIDAENHSIDSYCRRAIQLGLDGICFTPHYEADPKRAHIDGLIRLNGQLHPMANTNWLEAYFSEIDTARERYHNELLVLAGIEIGYEYGQEEVFAKLLSLFPFDYVLGSVHTLDHIAISSAEESPLYFADKSAPQVAADYFAKLSALVDSGLFDCIGHLDLYRRHGQKHFGAFEIDNLFAGWLEPILAKAAKLGMGLEVNASSIRIGQNECLPSKQVLSLAQKCGVRYFTVGSDAHRVEDLASGLDKALAQLTKMELNVATFRQRDVIKLDKPPVYS